MANANMEKNLHFGKKLHCIFLYSVKLNPKKHIDPFNFPWINIAL